MIVIECGESDIKHDHEVFTSNLGDQHRRRHTTYNASELCSSFLTSHGFNEIADRSLSELLTESTETNRLTEYFMHDE